MGRTIRFWVLSCACVLVAASAFAQQPSLAGRIKVASGEAVILRNGTTIPVQTGLAVYPSDSLRTGDTGKVGVTLADEWVHPADLMAVGAKVALGADSN